MTRLQIRRMVRGYIIGGHALAIVGAYLLAKGINQIPASVATGDSIFTPVFTGLMLILGAGCLLGNAVGMTIRPKVNWVKELIKDWPKK